VPKGRFSLHGPRRHRLRRSAGYRRRHSAPIPQPEIIILDPLKSLFPRGCLTLALDPAHAKAASTHFVHVIFRNLQCARQFLDAKARLHRGHHTGTQPKARIAYILCHARKFGTARAAPATIAFITFYDPRRPNPNGSSTPPYGNLFFADCAFLKRA
jgi:hypothetical protein